MFGSEWNAHFAICILHLFLLLFFLAQVSALGDKSIIYALFSIVHKLKNIKNKFYGTIYTFKIYFATLFSVSTKIICIQTDLYLFIKKNC